MNNNKIPLFVDAKKEFKSLLKSLSYPTSLCWVFLDDLYQKSVSETIIHIPIPDNRLDMIHKAYSEGRERGMVMIKGLCSIGATTVATVWYPKTEEDRIQGFEYGTNISVNDPFSPAKTVGDLQWWLLKKLSPYYKQYHNYNHHLIFLSHEIA